MLADDKATWAKFLPDVVSGRKARGIALTEPEHGSDLTALETSAVLDGDAYDIGHIDGDAFLFVRGRTKDIVIRAAENVACAHVEAAILRYPAMGEVAVVGLPHPDLGEEVGAVVVPRHGLAPEAAELAEFVAGSPAHFRGPVGVVDQNRRSTAQRHRQGREIGGAGRMDGPPERRPAGVVTTHAPPPTARLAGRRNHTDPAEVNQWLWTRNAPPSWRQ